jgi:hypothetical protein
MVRDDGLRGQDKSAGTRRKQGDGHEECSNKMYDMQILAELARHSGAIRLIQKLPHVMRPPQRGIVQNCVGFASHATAIYLI